METADCKLKNVPFARISVKMKKLRLTATERPYARKI
jgi:hypothetical protein